MIDLITGLPGNCKTLFTISWLRKFAKAENRPVFYSGIPLSDKGKAELGWSEIDPEKWMEAGPGSIVVIDECQRIFRNRSINSQPPKYVSDLETHRHLGIDLVFITQHPMLIDPAIRRLTGRHRHMVRIFGMQASTIHEWNSVRDNCDKPASRKDSEKTKWIFDKSVYSLYKSAELHTGKRMIPKRVLLLFAVPLAIAAAVFTVKHLLLKKPVLPGASPAGAPGASYAGQGSAPRKAFDPVEDAKEYAWKNTPRVMGVAYTAPKYDAITTPTTAPVPAACIHMGKRCSCYSQQATPLDVAFQQCVQIAHHGYFQDFDPNGNARRDQSVQVLNRTEALPLSGASGKDAPIDHAPLVASNADGYGVLGKRGPGVRQRPQDSESLHY